LACGLCAYQWYGQTLQRIEITRLNQMVFEKSTAIQGYTNSIATMDHQIATMQAQLAELRATLSTNEALVVTQSHEITRLETAHEGLTNAIVQYKNAVGGLEEKLKEAYEGIQKQNESLRQVVIQRDEFVQKFNDSVKARNEIVTKYNDLVDRVQKQDGGRPAKQ
jgi:chromosome segregation ATPase